MFFQGDTKISRHLAAVNEQLALFRQEDQFLRGIDLNKNEMFSVFTPTREKFGSTPLDEQNLLGTMHLPIAVY